MAETSDYVPGTASDADRGFFIVHYVCNPARPVRWEVADSLRRFSRRSRNFILKLIFFCSLRVITPIETENFSGKVLGLSKKWGISSKKFPRTERCFLCKNHLLLNAQPFLSRNAYFGFSWVCFYFFD